MDLVPELMNWNTRGLNDPAKRDAVREFVEPLHVNLVCLQETKMQSFDRYTVLQCLGPSFDGFAFLPAVDTRGGILIAWDTTVLEVTNIVSDSFMLTGEVVCRSGAPWWLTVVYGPQTAALKLQFLEELEARRALYPGPWMMIGDFNMILRA